MDQLAKMKENGTFELLPKKEVAKLELEMEKLDKYLGGVKNMKTLPKACLLYTSYPFGFFSADYFPLIPWLFMFWTGFYLYHLVGKERCLLYTSRCV